MRDLYTVAVKLGFYDAADYIRFVFIDRYLDNGLL